MDDGADGGKIRRMAKLVNIFADDTVKVLAMGMVHQDAKQRARTERQIRAHLAGLHVRQAIRSGAKKPK
jgi:hypothetical protein